MRAPTSTAAGDGLELHLDRALSGNTFDAHRVIHLARVHGLQAEAQERLFRAYFSEGVPISERETLVELAVSIGLDAARCGPCSRAIASPTRCARTS